MDDTGRLVGVLTVDDIVDVINQEADEDIKALAGVFGDEELSDTVGETARSRFPWLLLNLGTAGIAASVIGMFEGTIEQMVALAILMPIVASMGGNAGTQAMTVTESGDRELVITREFNAPLGEMAGMANMLISGVASAERIFELLDAEEQEPDLTEQASEGTLDPSGRQPAELAQPVHGRIEFDHVAFSYTPEKPLITDLSLTAEPGQTVAIVGPTGAGKTTLVNLLMRFYDVDAGRISRVSPAPRSDSAAKCRPANSSPVSM